MPACLSSCALILALAPPEHALLHIKSNVSFLGPAVGYRLEESGFSWTARAG
jgi:hypothetical protein